MSEHAAEQRRFYGKYRGKVTNTLDPMQRGRVQVSCYVVEVCPECRWNHLARTFRLGRKHAG